MKLDKPGFWSHERLWKKVQATTKVKTKEVSQSVSSNRRRRINVIVPTTLSETRNWTSFGSHQHLKNLFFFSSKLMEKLLEV